jgi:hypothetical protein
MEYNLYDIIAKSTDCHNHDVEEYYREDDEIDRCHNPKHIDICNVQEIIDKLHSLEDQKLELQADNQRLLIIVNDLKKEVKDFKLKIKMIGKLIK